MSKTFEIKNESLLHKIEEYIFGKLRRITCIKVSVKNTDIRK